MDIKLELTDEQGQQVTIVMQRDEARVFYEKLGRALELEKTFRDFLLEAGHLDLIPVECPSCGWEGALGDCTRMELNHPWTSSYSTVWSCPECGWTIKQDIKRLS